VEARLGVFECAPRGDAANAELRLGQWARNPAGGLQAGAFAFAVDHMLGEVTFMRRPDGWGMVTSELAIEFVELPHRPTALELSAHVTKIDGQVGHTQGTVADAAGRIVAVGSAWTQYLPPRDGKPTPIESLPEVSTSAADSIDEYLGITHGNTESGAVAELLRPGVWVNQFGIVHGGTWACLSEIAASRAIDQRRPGLRTAGLRTIYLRPGRADGPITATATLSHAGSSFAVADVDGRAADGSLCTMTRVTARAFGASAEKEF
jgi:uncharacterized protein (TIGR00369 family)